MKNIAVVYTFRYGHTKLLAEYVASGAESIGNTGVVLYTAEEAEKSLAPLDTTNAYGLCGKRNETFYGSCGGPLVQPGMVQ